MKVAITGAFGFVGKNLTSHLKQRADIDLVLLGKEDTQTHYSEKLDGVSVIFHLAGINRPTDDKEFNDGNVGATEILLNQIDKANISPLIVYSSSTQANLDNPYGKSKAQAESLLEAHAQSGNSRVIIHRITNIFGKWSRPNYNSVVATFCHNIARNRSIQIHDPNRLMRLVYIDDVIKEFTQHLSMPKDSTPAIRHLSSDNEHEVTLQSLADTISSFKESRSSLCIPNFENDLVKKLYTTYLSYLPEEDFGYHPEKKEDNRGWLSELIKSPQMGQIFVSHTKPGITRGDHYHHTKVEKFIVLKGDAVIRFRHILEDHVIEYQVNGNDLKIVDIPPGYTHNIENIGDTEMVVMFWANEMFDPENPDTVYLKV